MQDQVTALVAGSVNGLTGQECKAVGSVISGAVLRRVRAGSGESQEAFAARAGVPAAAVAGAEDGSCPAWALPYDRYEAIEAAVSVLNPGLREVFYAAAACDLYLAAMVKGDDQTADEALAMLRAECSGMAWSLLTWAVTGVLDGEAGEHLTAPSSAPLLPVEVVAELAGAYVTVLIDGCGCPDSRL